MQIDPIEQRPRNTTTIAANLVRRAFAFAAGVPEIATGTRIHRGNELESRRKCRLSRRPGNMDASRFDRLPKHFEHPAVPFRQLIEK